MTSDDEQVPVSYDPVTDTYSATFDGMVTRPSEIVVAVMATVREKDPLELDPLYEVIDPDALDNLWMGQGPAPDGGERVVSFTYEGHQVHVNSHGIIEVQPLPGDGEL